ncbi:MAG: GTPase HflX [Gammaproteobacteria bacterium]|nr:GTPase HflX [Gammaproteobacteria bacterium]MCY4296858.1 GTPase HflX [Gammaproteobacteria bacterium]
MFFERPDSGENCVLVHIDIAAEKNREDLAEFEELAVSAGAAPVAIVTGSRDRPESATFIGAGKIGELMAVRQSHGAELVLFNHGLTPSQERNLERELRCRVLDRTGLILDIFAQRARSHEGKLQVELAQLSHLRTRLKRGWSHLDRQKGGIGLRGAGEKQLELDQRMIGQRIKSIRKSLGRVHGRRELGRNARRRAELPTISLVGYTNAGKTSLFNRLTGAEGYAADQLFATLDPRLRRISLPGFGEAILADTVGFISHLPHQLIEAFKATLEETVAAQLLIHVVDAAGARRGERTEQVRAVLGEIGAQEIPQLVVCNKIDLCPGLAPRIDRDARGRPVRVWMSALTGAGEEELRQALGEWMGFGMRTEALVLPPRQAGLRSRLLARGRIESEEIDERGNFHIRARLTPEEVRRIIPPGKL